jgi:hypothetical protein
MARLEETQLLEEVATSTMLKMKPLEVRATAT